jgi:hypothetical protein
MTNFHLTLNLGGSSSSSSEPSLFLTFESTLESLAGDDPEGTIVNLVPIFTITSTPSPINIKYAVTFGSSPVATKIMYSKNGVGFVDTTANTNFADTFVNGDTLRLRVAGIGFGSEIYKFVLQNGSSTTISNEVQIVVNFES